MKCCDFYVGHQSAECPNDFPSFHGYKPRVLADATDEELELQVLLAEENKKMKARHLDVFPDHLPNNVGTDMKTGTYM